MSLDKNNTVSGSELLEQDKNLIEKASDTVDTVKDNVSNTLSNLSENASGKIQYLNNQVRELFQAKAGKDAPFSNKGKKEYNNIQKTNTIAKNSQKAIDKLKLPFKIIGIGVMALMLSNCAHKPSTPEEIKLFKNECESQGNINNWERYIATSNGSCIKTVGYGVEDLENMKFIAKDPDKMIVVIHGDITDIKHAYKVTREIHKESGDNQTILIVRPGYEKDSTSINWTTTGKGETKWRTHKKYINDMAEVIKKLKKKTGTKEVYAVGYSAGAIILSIIIAKYPGLVDKVALYGGFYNLDKLDWSSLTGSLNPIRYTGEIPKEEEVLVMFGEKDNNFGISNDSKKYTDKLIENGINAEYKEIKGQGHNYNWYATKEAVKFFLKNNKDLNIAKKY